MWSFLSWSFKLMELPMLMKSLLKSDSAVSSKSPMLLWYCHFFKKLDCLLPKGCARTSHDSTCVFLPVSYLQVMSCYWHVGGQIRHRHTSPSYTVSRVDPIKWYQIRSFLSLCKCGAWKQPLSTILSTWCRAATSVEQDARIDRGSIAKTLFQWQHLSKEPQVCESSMVYTSRLQKSPNTFKQHDDMLYAMRHHKKVAGLGTHNFSATYSIRMEPFEDCRLKQGQSYSPVSMFSADSQCWVGSDQIPSIAGKETHGPAPVLHGSYDLVHWKAVGLERWCREGTQQVHRQTPLTVTSSGSNDTQPPCQEHQELNDAQRYSIFMQYSWPMTVRAWGRDKGQTPGLLNLWPEVGFDASLAHLSCCG